jgi:pSer/pThr/pTyr-binding forkhead associated (FHA) protein
MLRITILRRGVPEHVVDLSDRLLRIGRGVANELLLTDPENTVSRTHARIVRSGDGWTFIDQDSLNGSWMDGQLVERVRLAPGMVITLGDYELRCEARDMRGARPDEETRLHVVPPCNSTSEDAGSAHDTDTRGTAGGEVEQRLAARVAEAAAGAGAGLAGPAATGDSDPNGTTQ